VTLLKPASAIPFLLAVCVNALAAPPRLDSESVRSGSAKTRVVKDDGADLVIFYGGEQEGELGTCGCDGHQRGSMARVHGYLKTVAKADDAPPHLLLNAGAWLSNTIGNTTDLRLDARAANLRMTEAVELAGWDVLNVGFRDMPWFREAPIPSRAVSANVRPTSEGGPSTYEVVTVGDFKVAVTGVSGEGMLFLQPDDYAYGDPVASVEALLPEMRKEADLIVALGYGLGKAVSDLTTLDIDILIEAGEYKEQHEPVLEHGTLWVRSRWRTERLGELRLFIDNGEITAAVDRMVDMDDEIPSTPALRKLERKARVEIDRALKEAFGS